MRRIYLAGPMTGLPQKNYPLFHAEASRLRGLGFEVVSPAELWPLDSEGEWANFMRVDLAAMLTCDAVVLLPGWDQSKGARLEQYNAAQLGMPCMAVAALHAEAAAA